MGDYLWKKLSKFEIAKLEREAKELILAFGDELEKLPKMKEVVVEREKNSREEGSGKDCDKDFRKLMFENAPDVDKDCIKAEKGGWVE